MPPEVSMHVPTAPLVRLRPPPTMAEPCTVRDTWLAVRTTVRGWLVGTPVRAGRRVGDYVLEAPIGAGSMGVVWRARHRRLGRLAAVKLVSPPRDGAATRARFLREARGMAALTHPNAATVFDVDCAPGGGLYYAMEHLDGVDLETLVDRHGPLPPGRVAHLVAQVAGALDAAHRMGLVHRDVKPSNVMVSGDGATPDLAKLVDFGLVTALGGAGAGGDPRLSHDEAILGTPLYLAPEAVTDPRRVDARADLYGLGCVAWHLLVGRPPFRGRGMVEVCAAHLHEAPARPSHALGRPLPRDVEDLVLACLAKDPADRPASAGALRRALLRTGAAAAWDEERAATWWAARGRAPAAAADVA